MKNADIEKRLAVEISKEVPDVLDSILFRCEPKNEKIVDFEEYKKEREEIESKRKNKNKRGKSMYVAAAMFMLVFSSFFGFLYNQSQIVETVVLIDINPEIELKANKKDRVVSAKGLNEDGKKVVEKMQSSGIRLKGTEIGTVTTEIMSAIIREGFASGESTILVTVENPNNNRGQEIEARLIKNVDDTLKSKDIEGTIIGQNKNKNDDSAKLVATKLGTTVRLAKGANEISKVAVCGGSGCSFMGDVISANAHAFVTGDAKHNDFLDAINDGLTLVAAGHYETENPAMPVLAQKIKTQFPTTDVVYIDSLPTEFVTC